MTTPDPLDQHRDADERLVRGLLEALEHLRNADRARAMRALMEATESAERVIG